MIKFEKLFHRGRKHYLQGHIIRSKIYRVLIKLIYQCDIPLAAEISENTYFCHNAFGVVINPNSKIMGGGNSTQRYDRRTRYA